MFTITSIGSEILHTDYFNSLGAIFGHMFLSWHENHARLLIPLATFNDIYDKIEGAHHAIITSGVSRELGDVTAVEITFLFPSEAPFVMTIHGDRSDCMPDLSMRFDIEFLIYCEDGLQFRFPAIYQEVPFLNGFIPTLH